MHGVLCRITLKKNEIPSEIDLTGIDSNNTGKVVELTTKFLHDFVLRTVTGQTHD